MILFFGSPGRVITITFCITKMKTKLIFIAIIGILMAGILGAGYLYLKEKKIKERWEQNYNLAKADLSRFKDKTGQRAVKLHETQLTLTEVRKQNGELYKEALNLKIKKRQLEQLLSVKTETIYDSVLISIHDTTIIRVKDTIRQIAYMNTKWLDVSIAVKDKELEILNYTSRDEVVIILYWFKNSKFFLTRWFERKKWGSSIKSMNPHSIITQAKNIKITKKVGR